MPERKLFRRNSRKMSVEPICKAESVLNEAHRQYKPPVDDNRYDDAIQTFSQIHTHTHTPNISRESVEITARLGEIRGGDEDTNTKKKNTPTAHHIKRKQNSIRNSTRIHTAEAR